MIMNFRQMSSDRQRWIVLSLFMTGVVLLLLYKLPDTTWTQTTKIFNLRQDPPVPELQFQLLDPYKVPDDPKIPCVPLQSAKNKEPICTYRTEDDAYISKHLNEHQVWEGGIVTHVVTLMARDPRLGFIDIGTNLGIFTLTLASYGRQVVGVEPFPPNLQRLSKTLRLNPHVLPYVKIVPKATSDKYQQMHFWFRNKHPGGTQLHPADASAKLGKGITHHEVPDASVDTIKVDDLLQVINFKKAILKIDIEGGEYGAFKGASHLFEKLDIRYVFMEWDNKCRFPIWRKFFIKFFTERLYTVHKSTPQMEELDLSEEGCKSWPFDVIFMKH